VPGRRVRADRGTVARSWPADRAGRFPPAWVGASRDRRQRLAGLDGLLSKPAVPEVLELSAPGDEQRVFPPPVPVETWVMRAARSAGLVIGPPAAPKRSAVQHGRAAPIPSATFRAGNAGLSKPGFASPIGTDD
jgi:hypothetical protein